MMVVAAFFIAGLGDGRTLESGDWTSLVDLVAIGGTVFVGMRGFIPAVEDPALPRGRFGFRILEGEARALYLVLAYVGLLAWTLRELTPLDHGPALASLALSVEGTLVLVAGFVKDRGALQKTGMITLLVVVGKLLVVDLQAVDPIWRVMLFSLIGVLFLALSKFVQGRRSPT